MFSIYHTTHHAVFTVTTG